MTQPAKKAARTATRGAAKLARAGVRQVADPEGALGGLVPKAVRKRIPGVRRRLPTDVVAVIDRVSGRTEGVTAAALAAAAERPDVPDTPVRLWIGPANFAGQGWAWGNALERNVEGVGARSMAVVGPLRFRVDYEVTRPVYRHIRWQREQAAYVTQNYTHALIEAERPLFGPLHGRSCSGELPRLAEAGLTVGLISHGSDLRIPSRHAQLHPDSPFTDLTERTTANLERTAQINASILAQAADRGLPTFVSTPDLVDYAPAATWCPGVVDLREWASDWPLMARARPRVVHVPSNGRLKGSELVDPIMRRLHEEGVIEYASLRNLPYAELRSCYQEADIVLDQFVLGLYGVAAVEAMAAGRVVVAYVGDTVRERVRAATGLEVPIVEATAATVEQVVRDLVADPGRCHEIAHAGRAFVEAVHDGRYSATVLSALTGGSLRAADDVPPPPASAPVGAPPDLAPLPPRPAPDRDAPVRLWVGPVNFAGQGTAWARAAQRELPGVSARSMGILRNPVFAFEADYVLQPHPWNRDPAWGARTQRYLGELYTHVLVEAGRRVTGYRSIERSDHELDALREAGVRIAHIVHGSESRIPSRHARLHPATSPFTSDWDVVPKMEEFAVATTQALADAAAAGEPVFCSTPDLLDHVPAATWCPVVVDPERWRSDAPVLERAVPVVAHAPSLGRLKGSELVDPLLHRLHEEGVIDYRRIEGVAPERMPEVYRDADIVLDQFVLGLYGVAACEAMAAGRVTVAYVGDAVRRRVREATGLEVPIVEATPDTLEETLRTLLADRDAAREFASAGPGFVADVHDGRRSAAVLADWLGAGVGVEAGVGK